MRYRLMLFRPTLGQGGADRVTITLLRELDRRQFDLSLALVKQQGEYLDDIPADVKLHILGASRVATSWLPLTRFVQATKPDVIFSTSSGTNVIALAARALTGIQCRVVLSERNVLLHGKITLKKKFILWLKQLFYAHADHITAVSQGVKDDLVSKLRLPPDKISVVYNPVVTEEMARLAQESVNHPWFGGAHPIVLGVGRLVAEKDFDTLVRAFGRVRAKQSAKLVILGEGPLRASLTGLVQQLKLDDDVALVGFDKNPFKYMARCSVFVLSSRFEGLPGALIQAMACGVPVISTDCPSGPSEIITQGQDGILVPMGDVNKMAEQIIFLLENRSDARGLGERARASAQRFRVESSILLYQAALVG